jgi:hypothetical protein
MNSKIEKIKNFRIHLLRQIEDLTPAQLNTIPATYSNNIIWNLGHLTAAMQNVCYVKAGLPPTIEEQYFKPFMPGTKPEGVRSETDIKKVKEILITSTDQLQADYDKKIFVNYVPPPMILKIYGFEILDIDSALEYVLYHDGYHTGVMNALKHLV